MHHSRKKRMPAQEVKRPILIGTWHGRDAYQLGFRAMISMVTATVGYLLLGTMFGFDSIPLRIILCIVIVALLFLYTRSQGLARGQGDAAFSEIMFQRQQEGKSIDKRDQDRCYHPAKGFFAAFIGALPFVAVTLVFAVVTEPAVYTLGTLPGWLGDLTRQNEFGDALRYYESREGFAALDALRIFCRVMVMPFINVAVMLGDEVTLWTERMSPLLILIAPLGFAVGYRGGLRARIHINTSIAIGDEKKRRKERRERKRRARNDTPERLI